VIINETKAHPIEALSIDTISNEAFSIKSQKRKPKPYRLRYSNATFMRCKTTFIFVTLCIVFGIRTVSLTWAQIESAAIVDRYDEVFKRENSEKRLTAWFLKLSLSEESNIDEKSGDSTIIISPDDRVMLIDGGALSCGALVCSYLHALEVDRIYAILLSHPHIYHVGGLISVLQ